MANESHADRLARVVELCERAKAHEPTGFSADPETGAVYGKRGLVTQRNHNGYVICSRKTADGVRTLMAHRIVWEVVNGPIPEGLTLGTHTPPRGGHRRGKWLNR